MKSYTPQEQKANRKLWVAALRSGEYKQGKGYLCLNDCYCCMGVLCEVGGVDKVQTSERLTYAYNGESQYAPASAVAFVGLFSSRGDMPNSKPLTLMNDNGASFSQIADIIESEPPGLFTS